jgi:predicted nucleic acid-binding protein
MPRPASLRVAISVEEQQADLRALIRRYRNRPMSLADACLVRLSEIHAVAEVLTLDGDFRIYRRHGNKVIPVRMPD